MNMQDRLNADIILKTALKNELELNKDNLLKLKEIYFETKKRVGQNDRGIKSTNN